MLEKQGYALIFSALLLTACGGGGGGGAAPSVIRPTAISGTVTPPAAPISGASTASLNMLVAPNSTGTWNAVVQAMEYIFDSAAAAATPATLKVVSLNIHSVDTQSGALSITTGAAYPTDAALGQTTQINNTVGITTYIIGAPFVPTLTTALAGLPTVTLTSVTGATGYVLPYSATLNPSGYTYQTFGSWVSPIIGGMLEGYFSAGVVTVPATLPVAGTASYTGQVAGSYVDAATRDPADVRATMNATADFGARTVAFATTGSTSLSNNAAAGTPYSAATGLNMSGTLAYAAGNNTFTGAVTTTNGMSGNATGRFYGPGIGVATATKVVGAPPEIGGTFAVTGTVGAMQGAFGGK